MKNGDLYRHFRTGNEYYFIGIAQPLNEFAGRKIELNEINLAYDAHTPKNEDVRRVQLYNHKGLMLIDRENPHVVYQSEHDYNTDKVWVREVEEFFDFKEENGIWEKRFKRL